MCWQRDDTWFLSTTGDPTWTELTTRLSGRPCRVQGHLAAYDAQSNRVLVFGGGAFLGNSCPDHPTVVWALSLKDSAWTIENPGMIQPWHWFHATGVLDPDTHRVLVYGGEDDVFSEGSAMADVWALTLDPAPSWRRVMPQGEDPAPSGWSNSAVYDPLRRRLLIYRDDEVWCYPLRAHVGWIRLEFSAERPRARLDPVVVYDSMRDRLIVFGGAPAPGSSDFLTDTWALSLNGNISWERIPTRASPSGRQGSSGIYDPVRDRLVVFGGGDWIRTQGDVWTLSLGDDPEWAPLEPSGPAPSPRMQHSAIYDSKRDRMVVFGGGGPGSDSWHGANDVWELSLGDSPTWRLLDSGEPYSALPTGRVLQATVYDPVGDQMIVVGGFIPGAFQRGPFRDLWSLDFESLRWTRLDATDGPVPNWAAPLAIYDPSHHRMVVGEGDYLWALELNARAHVRDEVSGRGDELRAGPSPDRLDSAELRLQPLNPNPSKGPFFSEFSLPSFAPATLEFLDLAGRRLWSKKVGGLGPGHHRMEIDGSERLPAGIYLLRLKQGESSETRRALHLK